ncbi:hypothetical protein NQZ68_019761 [Dissostichus eleginoides]|nr:hypothetical protein NQZ68_019761 [Dissostichus eleginoides]
MHFKQRACGSDSFILQQWKHTHVCERVLVSSDGSLPQRGKDDPPPVPPSSCGSTATPPAALSQSFTEPHNLSASTPPPPSTHTQTAL